MTNFEVDVGGFEQLFEVKQCCTAVLNLDRFDVQDFP